MAAQKVSAGVASATSRTRSTMGPREVGANIESITAPAVSRKVLPARNGSTRSARKVSWSRALFCENEPAVAEITMPCTLPGRAA